MVFYRKYRPQTISELDNKDVRDTLLSVLSKKEPPHAFLFTGPKGLGKTSTARIVAKVLNCEKSSKSEKGIEPCNKCEQCVSITNGTNMDILEIDAASNRGIDEIRDLREKIRLSPLSARKKVYIIDEVHMLTTEAFNALLKTLEEPPTHVVFVLCTTELHKVPATILSRCFHIQFTLATPEELARSFERIVKAEHIKVDDDALEYITKISGGSFRDGTKLLEEVFLGSNGEKITKDFVQKKLNTQHVSTSLKNMYGAIMEKNTKQALEFVVQLIEQGTDIKYFLETFIQELHGVMLSKLGVSKEKALLGSEQEITDIKRLVELLSNAYKEMKTSVLPQLPLELAIIEYTHSSSSLRPRPAGEAISTNEIATPRQDGTRDDDKNDILKQLIVVLKTQNPSLVGLLRGFKTKEYTSKHLVLETKYTYHKERLGEKKMLLALTEAVKKVTGKDIEISISLSS